MGYEDIIEHESEYLIFSKIVDKPKSAVYGIYTKSAKDEIGIVKWYPRWRQYCFFPDTDTVWNKTCLNEVQGFINMLMRDR